MQLGRCLALGLRCHTRKRAFSPGIPQVAYAPPLKWIGIQQRPLNHD